MKGMQASRIYHFETKSTGRVRRNNGSLQFLLKWGMTSSTFRKYITRRGQDYDSSTADIYPACSPVKWRINIMRGRLKAVWSLVFKGFGIINFPFEEKESH